MTHYTRRQRQNWLLPALVLLYFCGSARPASADEGAESERPAGAPSYDLDALVIRSSRIREARDDPSSFATVLRPDEFASQFRTTEDLLSRTPGVNIRSANGQFSTVSIRGSSAEQVLVLLDGVRINTGEGGSVDFSTIPLESVERIEVIRGGGTTIYGADAVGGVVNIVTRKPAPTPEVAAAATCGSLDTVKGWVTGSAGGRNASALVSVTHFQSEGDFDYETPEVWIQGRRFLESRGGRRLNNDYFSDNVLVKADFSPAGNLDFHVLNDLFYTERGQPGSIFDPREAARQNLFRNLTTLGVEGKGFILGDLKATLDLFHRYDRSHFRDPRPGQGVPSGPGVPGLNPIDTVSRNLAYGCRAGLDLYRSLWKTEHLVSGRGEFRREELYDEVASWQKGYDDPARMSYEWRLQDEVVFLDNRLSLVPAVRYEESTDFGHHWTGKIGVVARPRPWLYLKSHFENTFRRPNFSELYYPDQGFIRGNPDLKAERGRNLDAGFGLDFSRFYFEAVYFRNWIEESILWIPVSFWTVAPVNTGPVDRQGLELDTEFRPADFLALTANYTLLDAVTRETGRQQDGRPRHTANFKASLRGKPGEIYSEVQYLSRVPVHFTDTSEIAVNERVVLDLGVTLNLLSLPWLDQLGGFEQAGGSASGGVPHRGDSSAFVESPDRSGSPGRGPRLNKWTLTFEVKNATDQSVYDSQYFPLPGRMFFLTLHAAL